MSFITVLYFLLYHCCGAVLKSTYLRSLFEEKYDINERNFI